MQETWDQAIEDFNMMRAEKKEKGEKVDVKEAWAEFWKEARAKNLD